MNATVITILVTVGEYLEYHHKKLEVFWLRYGSGLGIHDWEEDSAKGPGLYPFTHTRTHTI